MSNGVEAMAKTTMKAAVATIISLSLVGCAADMNPKTPGGIQTPTTSAPMVHETVKPTTATPATPTVTPAPTQAPVESAKPSQTPEPTATPTPKKAIPTNEATGDRAPLSWYYMKKKTGQVPDFPKETKSFTQNQKAMWVGKGKKVYLTIDAGGPLIDVDMMLKALKDNNVKANFFITGYNIKQNPDYLKRLVADGHFIGNHTMTHRDFNLLKDDEIKKEITDFEKLYKEITGKDLEKYFRFPYGRYNMHDLSLVSEMGYTSVFWSTAMKDWEPRKNGAEDPYNDIMNNLHDGNVILMHQGSKENMEALDKICKAIKKAGYEFALVNES
jgi:peptidoglycan-N-acetylmuramic acid deacetylase